MFISSMTSGDYKMHLCVFSENYVLAVVQQLVLLQLSLHITSYVKFTFLAGAL